MHRWLLKFPRVLLRGAASDSSWGRPPTMAQGSASAELEPSCRASHAGWTRLEWLLQTAGLVQADQRFSAEGSGHWLRPRCPLDEPLAAGVAGWVRDPCRVLCWKGRALAPCPAARPGTGNVLSLQRPLPAGQQGETSCHLVGWGRQRCLWLAVPLHPHSFVSPSPNAASLCGAPARGAAPTFSACGPRKSLPINGIAAGAHS